MDAVDAIHDVCLLACLRLVDDKEHPAVFLCAQVPEHVQGDLLHDQVLIPGGPPKKFAVIGPVGCASDGLGQPIDCGAMADGDGHNQGPEVFPGPLGEVAFERFEETVQFFTRPGCLSSLSTKRYPSRRRNRSISSGLGNVLPRIVAISPIHGPIWSISAHST